LNLGLSPDLWRLIAGRWDRGNPTSMFHYLLTGIGCLLLFRDRSFTGVRDILRATCFENFLRAIALVAILSMNRQKDVPAFDLSLVAFRLILGNTHADEFSHQSSGCCAASRAGQSCHDRTRRDKGSEPRNRQRPDTHHPAQRSAKNCAAACSGRRAFRSLCMLLVSEILGSLLVGKKNRYVVLGEAGRFRIFSYRDRLRLTLCYAKYCLLCHVLSPYY